MSEAKWIAVDWGTSNLRIWAMGDADEVLSEIISDQGMSNLHADEFEPLLVSLIDPWMTSEVMPVIACGMVGSRQGWIEAPYDTVPTSPAKHTVRAPTRDARIDVRIVVGIKQLSPADVMRGEETQIAGCIGTDASFKGLVCLPGTHSKWARVDNGQITQFQTVLTGELFDAMACQTVLRHSMFGWDDSVFRLAVKRGFEAPETLVTRLFNIRANHLLNEDENGRASLSGMIIGAEIAALKHLWENQKLIIIGDGKLARLYDDALSLLGAETEVRDVTQMTLSGLTAVYKELFL